MELTDIFEPVQQAVKGNGKWYIAGGIGIVALLALLMRSSGGGAPSNYVSDPMSDNQVAGAVQSTQAATIDATRQAIDSIRTEQDTYREKQAESIEALTTKFEASLSGLEDSFASKLDSYDSKVDARFDNTASGFENVVGQISSLASVVSDLKSKVSNPPAPQIVYQPAPSTNTSATGNNNPAPKQTASLAPPPLKPVVTASTASDPAKHGGVLTATQASAALANVNANRERLANNPKYAGW